MQNKDKKSKQLDETIKEVDFRNKSKFGWKSHKETIYTNSKTQEATDEIINSVKNIDADTINNVINQFSNFTSKH